MLSRRKPCSEDFGIGLKLFQIVVMMDDICSLDYRVAYRFLLCVLKHEKYQPKT